MKSWWKRAQPLAIIMGIAVMFGACDEQLDSGGACPALCPVQSQQVTDTTFFAIAMDTTVPGFPTQGLETRLYIVSYHDTLQTRGIVRFDGLPQTFRHTNSAVDSLPYVVDTGAVMRVFVAVPDTLGIPTTVEAYDVDLGGPDDVDPNAVGSAFTPDRVLGTRTIPPESLKDSIDIPIDPARLITRIRADTPYNRLRVGIKVTSPSGSAKISLFTSNSAAGTAPRLLYRPSPGDTTVPITTVSPSSSTPASQPAIADALRDYLVVTVRPADPPTDVLRVGGLPGRRIYLRFDVPSRLIDSTSIIRAELTLTQRPSASSPEPYDTVAMQQFAVTASSEVTDIVRALQLLVNAREDSIRAVPTDSGPRTFEMREQLSFWRFTTAERTPRAMALRLIDEGHTGGQIDFFSSEAPPEVRPTLRITYLPRPRAGLP